MANVTASLTKRRLIRAIRKATRDLSADAMKVKGYVIKAENGWVVKVNHTGQKKRLSRIICFSQTCLD